MIAMAFGRYFVVYNAEGVSYPLSICGIFTSENTAYEKAVEALTPREDVASFQIFNLPFESEERELMATYERCWPGWVVARCPSTATP